MWCNGQGGRGKPVQNHSVGMLTCLSYSGGTNIFNQQPLTSLSLPPASTDHFDLSVWAFEKLADVKWGVIGERRAGIGLVSLHADWIRNPNSSVAWGAVKSQQPKAQLTLPLPPR